MPTRKALALEGHLAEVDGLAQHREQVLLIDAAARAVAAILGDPGLAGLAFDRQSAQQLRGRAMLGKATKDIAHQRPAELSSSL